MSLPRLRPGPLLMVGATLTFSVMVACLKVARQEMGTVELMAWRGAIGVPLTLLLLRRGPWLVHNKPVLLLRVVLGTCAMFSFFTAARGLSLADMGLISRLQPIGLALLAPVVLGASERPSARVWSVMAVGVAGCAVLLAPQLQVGSAWGLWAVAATVFSACAHLSLRVLGRTEHSAAVVLWFQVGVTAIAGTVALLGSPEGLSLPPARLWPYVAGAGVAATAGQLLMTRAYQLERAATVAAASYLTPLWGVLGDLLLFADWPSLADAVGGTLIVGAGLWLIFGPDPRGAAPADQETP